jgi:hypothetical protein
MIPAYSHIAIMEAAVPEAGLPAMYSELHLHPRMNVEYSPSRSLSKHLQEIVSA